MSIFFIKRGQTPSLYRIEIVNVLYREETDPFSLQEREREREIERLTLFLSSLYRGRRLFFSTVEREREIEIEGEKERERERERERDTVSLLYRGGRLLLFTEESECLSLP